ncbi:MAG: 6-carboxytetrahydropterin synthase [Terriglobia bacterium]
MVHLTRRYRFAAAHRLHSGSLTAEENARIYGKCNNPYGHGHNYILDVTVAGPVNPATGMVCDITILDSAVQKEILEPLDRAHLNWDVERFQNQAPTTENLCIEIYRILLERLASELSEASLKKVRLEETSSNFFDYEG